MTNADQLFAMLRPYYPNDERRRVSCERLGAKFPVGSTFKIGQLDENYIGLVVTEPDGAHVGAVLPRSPAASAVMRELG